MSYRTKINKCETSAYLRQSRNWN